MSGTANPEAPANDRPVSPGPLHRDLIERVSNADALQNSRRLRELLVFLCDWSANHPGEAPTEEQVGVAVFGRTPGFDTGADSIVRVQISCLRRKVKEYFRAEGAAEPIVLDLPTRSYAPVFRPRQESQARPDDPLPAAEARWKRAFFGLSAVVLVLVVAGGWLVWDNARLRSSLPPDYGQTPLRDHFWMELFRNGLPTQVVVSDAASMVVADAFTHLPSLFDYRSRNYPRTLIDSDVRDPAARGVLARVSPAYLTTVQDTRIAAQLWRILPPLGIAPHIVYARDFNFQPELPGNLILVGHKKANPWTEAFEQSLNFRYAWEPGPPTRVRLLNMAPRAGEQPFYDLRFAAYGYSVVARVPRPAGNGTVLLLDGTDMGSVEAGWDLLSTEQQLKEFYRRLGIKTGGPIPFFEVLLKTRLLGRGVHTSSAIIAFRVLRTETPVPAIAH